jgi:hypothetical protein
MILLIKLQIKSSVPLVTAGPNAAGIPRAPSETDFWAAAGPAGGHALQLQWHQQLQQEQQGKTAHSEPACSRQWPTIDGTTFADRNRKKKQK